MPQVVDGDLSADEKGSAMKRLLFAALVLTVAGWAPAQELTLATRGQPATCTIVCSAAASPSQVHAAAEELQRFAEQMTGVKLPIDRRGAASGACRPARQHAVHLRPARRPGRRERPGRDGFRQGDRLLVLGGPVRGTLYGVYELLERFGGCRWYSSWYSAIPRREAFTVPVLDETQKPAFALREPFWFDMFDDPAARNKVNGNAMRLDEKHGGHSYRFGGGLGKPDTFNTLCSPDVYFAAHPEVLQRDLRQARQRLHATLPFQPGRAAHRHLQRFRAYPTGPRRLVLRRQPKRLVQLLHLPGLQGHRRCRRVARGLHDCLCE